MAIAVVNIPTALVDNTGGASLTLSMQCDTGTDFLSVGIASYQSITDTSVSSITSVTYNGVGLTYQTKGNAVSPNTSADDTHIYTLVAPTTGSAQNLVVNYSPNVPFGATLIPVCWSGVHQTVPIGNVASSYSAAATSPVSDAITMASGSVAFDIATIGTATPTVVGSQVQIYNAAWGGERVAASRLLDATAMGWTFTGTPRFAHSVIEIRVGGAAVGNLAWITA